MCENTQRQYLFNRLQSFVAIQLSMISHEDQLMQMFKFSVATTSLAMQATSFANER